MSPPLALLRSLRPHQWVKNLFVLAPLVFGRHLLDGAYLARGLAAALVFCLLSGAVYLFNDVRDVVGDRAHPKKSRRPIAAGHLSERAALIAAAAIAISALAGAVVLAPAFAGIAAAYLAINLAYSVRLKHVAFVDVALVASGFLLRVQAGATACAISASAWLLVCTGLLALLLGLGKRAHELAWAGRAGTASTTRAALAGYRLPVVRALLVILAVATVGAYVAYTLDPATVAFFATDRLIVTAPFPVLGIARFLWLAVWRPRDDSPTEAMLRDLPFLANLAAWAAVVVAVVYG